MDPGVAYLLMFAYPGSAMSPLALSCTGCHQPSVNSRAMPALNRLSATQLAASLRQARDQPRPDSIMTRFAAKLTDAQIDRLAAELSRPSLRR